MKDLYSRLEVALLLNPPCSVSAIRRMEVDGRMPKSVKKINKAHFYSKKEIDEWLKTGPKLRQVGRKKEWSIGAMADEEKDIWNIRSNKTVIKYSDEMVILLHFLKPNLKNRFVGNQAF